MTYWMLLYEVVDDYLERRTPYRPEHLALITAYHERGDALMAGAFDPPDGAALVFVGDDPKAAERFVAEDPYVRNGVVRSWKVRRWNVVVGGPKPP